MAVVVYVTGALFLGFFIGWLIQNRVMGQKNLALEREKSSLEEHIRLLQNTERELTEERNKVASLNINIVEARKDCDFLREKLEQQREELESLNKKFIAEFENLANRILKENSKEFSSVNQKNMDEIIRPLKERIESFEKQVKETYDKETRDKQDLLLEVKKLHDLNSKISQEAHNLTIALKGDVKKQGNWGEFVLERILEISGLQKDREYKAQFSTTSSTGERIQPDIVVFLPDNKNVVIDSKVSLIAYERYTSAETDEERQAYLKEHLQSIKNHIKILSEKQYHSSAELNSPDFVLMFIPIESCFSLAVDADQNLFTEAWNKKIVIVSPSTLLATLKTISSIWRQENQNKNAFEIARQGGLLYDKFLGFLNDMQKIDKGISNAKSAYDDAYKKLATGSGNILTKVEKLKELGASTNKSLPDELVPDAILTDTNDENEVA